MKGDKNMWDYDKLFTEDNILGILHPDGEIVPIPCKFRKTSNVENLNKYYGNENLSCEEYKIQYIICLDEHGNVIEKLFDREKDMLKPMPELKTGMFVLIFNCNHTETRLGYINAERNMIIYQSGGWDYIDENKDEILKVYSNNCNCFDGCIEHRVIWRNPEYQAYFNSKSN